MVKKKKTKKSHCALESLSVARRNGRRGGRVAIYTHQVPRTYTEDCQWPIQSVSLFTSSTLTFISPLQCARHCAKLFPWRLHAFIHSLIHSTCNVLSTDSARLCPRGWRYICPQQMSVWTLCAHGTTSGESDDKITNVQEIERESRGGEGGNSDEASPVLDQIVRRGFPVGVTFESRCVWSQESSLVTLWSKDVPSRGNRLCKCPEISLVPTVSSYYTPDIVLGLENGSKQKEKKILLFMVLIFQWLTHVWHVQKYQRLQNHCRTGPRIWFVNLTRICKRTEPTSQSIPSFS